MIVMAKADRRWIDPTDIVQALSRPNRREQQEDGRIRCWAYISRLKIYSRVVTLSDGETDHKFFKDRDFTE